MIDITRLITISEAAGAAIQDPQLSESVECPEEYKDLTLTESNLYFENQMLRCELEYRDIMDESVNDMIQSMIDQRNGIMTEAAEETEKKGFRAWVKKIKDWFAKIFKTIGDFFRNLIDKLTKHSNKTKEINDKFTENMKQVVAGLEHNQLADLVIDTVKEKPFTVSIDYIDGAFIANDEGIVSLRNAIINTDYLTTDINKAELPEVRYTETEWNDTISNNREIESAISKIFLFKAAKPRTYTDLFKICENHKSDNIEYDYNTALHVLTDNFALDHAIFNSISVASIGRANNTKIGPVYINSMVKYSTDTLKEWDEYSKKGLSNIDKAIRDLDNAQLTNDEYNRIRKNYTFLMSYYTKIYSTFTKLFNTITIITVMYQNNIIRAKAAYLKYTRDVIIEAKKKEVVDAQQNLRNSHKERMGKVIDAVDKVNQNIEKTEAKQKEIDDILDALLKD